jgi:hypothetical protein
MPACTDTGTGSRVLFEEKAANVHVYCKQSGKDEKNSRTPGARCEKNLARFSTAFENLGQALYSTRENARPAHRHIGMQAGWDLVHCRWQTLAKPETKYTGNARLGRTRSGFGCLHPRHHLGGQLRRARAA